MQFLAQYGKTYATKNHMNSKFQIFSKNYKAIKEHNSQGHDYEMGVNQYTDLTIEEFTELYHKEGLAMPTPEQRKNKRIHLRAIAKDNGKNDAPDFVDWREAGKVTVPQDQASCGSCWAFTTATTLESMFAIEKNTKPEKLSVQYLVDCDDGNFGCGGGWMLDAYEFTRRNGIVKEEDYPLKYQIAKKKCQKVDGKEKFYNLDQNEEDNISNERLKKLVSIRPVGVAMYSNPKCLMSYKSGILKEKDCKCSFEKTATVNHAVTVVGYGDVENNEDCAGYWLIKNSWGPNWGDKGFFKLCIPHETEDKKLPTGTCQVKSYVQYPLHE